MDAKRLRDLAAQALRDAAVMAEAGHAQLAERAVALARELLAEAALLTAEGARSTVDNVMTEEHRAALSESRWGDGNAVMNAAKARGIVSLRALAEKLGEDPGFLSKVIRGKRPMPERLARAIEKATGYPAASWRR